MKTKFLHQSLELHGDLFLTAPHEEGKLLSTQSEGAGPPSVSGGGQLGGLAGLAELPEPRPHRGLASRFSGTAAIAPIIAAVKDGKSITFEGREVRCPVAAVSAVTGRGRDSGQSHCLGQALQTPLLRALNSLDFST